MTSVGLTKAQRNQILTTTEITSATKALTIGQIEERIATELNSKEDAKAITQKLTKIGIISSESGATTSLTVDILEQAVANGTLTASEASSIASALGLTVANTSLSVSFKVLTSTIWANIKALLVWLTTNPVGWAILATSALYRLAKVFVENTTSIEEAKEETKKYVDTLSSINSEVENLESRLKDLNNQINNLNPITDAEDIENLKLESAELENQLAILKEKQRLANIEADKASQESLSMTQTSRYDFGEGKTHNALTGETLEYKTAVEVTRMKELQNAMDAYDEYANKQSELRAELAKLVESGEYTQEEWDNFETSINDLDIKMQETRTHASELASELNEEKKGLNGVDESSKKLLEDTNSVLNSYSAWTDEINTTTNALKENSNVQSSTLDNKNPDLFGIPETIDELNTKLKPAMDALGEAYKDIFTSDGFTRENIGLDMFSSIKDELDELSKADINIDYSSFEEFVSTLNNVNATSDEVDNAFDKFATTISRVVLSGTEDFETLKASLADLGVVNSEIVAFGALVKNTEALKEAGLDLSTATDEVITAFVNEKVSAEYASHALMLLKAQQIMLSDGGINTVEECNQLLNIAKAAKVGQIELQRLNTLMDLITKRDTAVKSGDARAVSELNRAIKDFSSQVTADLDLTGVEVDFKQIDTSSASSSAKSTADEYLEAFEEELKKLETLRDQGKISESEFLESYKTLYERYFKDIDKYADEFAEHQHERFKGLKDLYDSAISAIVSFKDKEIEALNEAKDKAIENLETEQKAREDVIDAQKEQLEIQVDLIDEQIESRKVIIDGIQGEIDLIQDEIDAMESANKKRKEQIDLQQKQKTLNDAMNQRTELAFVDNQMIYRPNDESIRNARQDVEDAEFNIAISEKKEQIAQKEKEISLIEKEIELFEKQKDAINEQIDTLDKQAENTEKYYDNLIEQQEKFYNAQTENLEKQKSQWEELAEVKEVADAYSAIEQVFGDLGYTVDDVLNNSAGVFEDFKSKYIDLLNTMNSNDSFGNGLSYAVDELDKSLANVGTNTEGLDNLVSKMDEVTSSVGNVSNAINGSGMSAMENGEETVGTGSNLKDALAEQTQDALVKLEEQSNAFSNGEDSLQGAVENVIGKVAGSSEGDNKKDSKEKESEADTSSLIGAIQSQYDKTVEVIPQQIEAFNLYESAIGGCVNKVNELISALERVQTLSSSINMGGVGLQPVNGYATGTTHAKKGLSIVGEEEPELIEDNKGKLSLVAKPTLLNMEGGEKVYNGEETEKLLKGNKTHDAWVEYTTKYANNPALLSASIMETSPQLFTASQDIWNRQMDYLTGKDKVAPRVENKSNSYSVGDVHIHCSGITSKDVAEQTVRELDKQLFGMQGYFRQQASITR